MSLIGSRRRVAQERTLSTRPGLFQGRLGFKRAIILLEEGCSKFSNIDGLTFINFPRGKVEVATEEITESSSAKVSCVADGKGW